MQRLELSRGPGHQHGEGERRGDLEDSLELRWHKRPAGVGDPNSGLVVATGVFDLLHVGHLRFLKAARSAGAGLVVGVEDDERTSARKGRDRPIVPLAERCEMLCALAPVDGVFSISGPLLSAPAPAYAELLRPLRPTILAFTEDDRAEAGKRLVASWLSCSVLVAPRVQGRSTTLLATQLLAGASSVEAQPLGALASLRASTGGIPRTGHGRR